MRSGFDSDYLSICPEFNVFNKSLYIIEYYIFKNLVLNLQKKTLSFLFTHLPYDILQQDFIACLNHRLTQPILIANYRHKQ